MSGAHERDQAPLTVRMRARVGRRGCCLMFFALVDLLYAAALLCAPPETARGSAYAFLVLILPLWAWAVPWAIVGLLCALYSWQADDRVAFAAASALSVGWSVLNLSGWLVDAIPRGWVQAVIWGGFAAFVRVIAGWPEPPRRS